MSIIKRVWGTRSLETPALDVAFLHGLDGDPVKTWSYGSTDSFWPQWLADDNPEAAVWCVGFDASASRWRGAAMGILDRAVNLLALLRTEDVGSRPLCLVGHSLGGLLAKQALVMAAHTAPEYRTTAVHARGVVFLGTPHDGASVARLARAFPILRATELLGDLVNDGSALRYLNTAYRNWAAGHGVDHLVFFETRGHGILRRLIVPESSADPKLPGATPIPVDADHTRICKPDSREHLVYAKVNQFVAGLVGRPGQTLVAAPRKVHDGREQRLRVQRAVFEAAGWAATLRRLYPRYELLEYMGAAFPIWAKLAAPEHWESLDAALGDLLPGEDPRQPGYPARFDPAGEVVYRQKLATADEVTSFDGATYALERIEMDGGRFKVHARHGTYFHSLATSELLEGELVDQLAASPGRAVDLDSLPRRRWLHDVAGGEGVVLDGRRRAAALSVAATMLIAEADGTFSVILARRSHRVQTHPMFSHVAPAGIFAPINAGRREDTAEFSVRNCILREYAEELFGYKDLEQGEGLLARDVSALPPIQELRKAQDSGLVALRYCGISVPLLTLRPEIYVLVLIKDSAWLDGEIRRADGSDHWFEFNWEYERTKDMDAVRLRLGRDLRPVDTSEIHPSRMVPHAAAALHLCTTVARTLVNPPGYPPARPA
ncbi:MAG TPA: hypothetical protein VFM55_16655 [Micromonosporaceae bacterium]|nr:hypothetical protein [Micromonosporaceae bacterium]